MTDRKVTCVVICHFCRRPGSRIKGDWMWAYCGQQCCDADLARLLLMRKPHSRLCVERMVLRKRQQ